MYEYRYVVRFTPVGWHVLDSLEARDPVAQFGLGHEEYARASAEAQRLNAEWPRAELIDADEDDVVAPE